MGCLLSRVLSTRITITFYIHSTQYWAMAHVDFYGGRKTEEKLSWQRREEHTKQTQLTYTLIQIILNVNNSVSFPLN